MGLPELYKTVPELSAEEIAARRKRYRYRKERAGEGRGCGEI